MARRKIYSNLNKVGQYRPEHVDGQTLYKVFQCLNPDCTEMITVKKDDIDEDYSIVCPKCGYEHYSGGEQHLFDFSMDVNNADGKTVSVQEGEFVVSHDEYIENAALYKHSLLFSFGRNTRECHNIFYGTRQSTANLFQRIKRDGFIST